MDKNIRENDAWLELLLWVSEHEHDGSILSKLANEVDIEIINSILNTTKSHGEACLRIHQRGGAMDIAYDALKMLEGANLIALDVHKRKDGDYLSQSNTVLTNTGWEALEEYKKIKSQQTDAPKNKDIDPA